jgi:uncharacterized 2Fe-2S/4Fe-4S cluster protein (DUF4445 family)
MKHFNVIFKSDGKQISIHDGATVLEAAAQAGIILNSVCGGKGICRKCAVILEPQPQEVLACQHRIHSDLTVTVPPESRFFEQKILARGIDVKDRIPLESPNIAARVFGLAVDIGTTTVVANLIDMTTAETCATEATLNPQTRYGDDVISRIAYAQTEDKLAELQKSITDCINELILKLCTRARIAPERINQACIVGNTTMNHIFLKLPVTGLGRAPYKPFSLDAADLSPEQIGLRINPAGNVHTVQNIAGFVGSDTTAVALAVDVNSAEEQTLVIDIGTNGEIVLGTKDKLYAASCAAGPAFEGARIACGSRAAEGAIEATACDEADIALGVIGDSPPRSICGSGLVDLVALLLELGVLDSSGRFVQLQKLHRKLPEALLSRLIQHENQPAFLLAQTENNTVFLTQQDIRQTQLAKAAIRAGIKILQKKIGLKDDDIKHIFLAGAFGNYIHPESAMRIGLLPEVPLDRIHFVGNAASSGAQMILLSRKAQNQVKEIISKITYVEIAHEPDFQSTFADCMTF